MLIGECSGTWRFLARAREQGVEEPHGEPRHELDERGRGDLPFLHRASRMCRSLGTSALSVSVYLPDCICGEASAMPSSEKSAS